jgi:hypothetical protein
MILRKAHAAVGRSPARGAFVASFPRPIDDIRVGEPELEPETRFGLPGVLMRELKGGEKRWKRERDVKSIGPSLDLPERKTVFGRATSLKP